jgi:hypothetical protein
VCRIHWNISLLSSDSHHDEICSEPRTVLKIENDGGISNHAAIGPVGIPVSWTMARPATLRCLASTTYTLTCTHYKHPRREHFPAHILCCTCEDELYTSTPCPLANHPPIGPRLKRPLSAAFGSPESSLAAAGSKETPNVRALKKPALLAVSRALS